MNFKQPFLDAETRDFAILPNGDVKLEEFVKTQNAFGSILPEAGSYIFDESIGIDWDDIAARGSSSYVYNLIESFIRDKFEIENLDVQDVTVDDFQYPFFTVSVTYIGEENEDPQTITLDLNTL